MPDREFPHLPYCHRCQRPIGEQAKKKDEPMICGPCHHSIFDEGGRMAVRLYCDGMRGGVSHA